MIENLIVAVIVIAAFAYVLRQFIVQIGKIALFKSFKRYADFFCLTCKLGIFKILVP